VVLPEEDADEFAGLGAAMIEELAPVGVLQTVLARRVAVAAWRLARANRIEAELFAERRFRDGGLGHALIRDGNGSRSFETLLRIAARRWRSSGVPCAQPPARGRILHEPAASWLPNEPEPGRDRQEAARSCSPRQAAPRPRSNEPNRLGKS
jgi:hypothetical protein